MKIALILVVDKQNTIIFATRSKWVIFTIATSLMFTGAKAISFPGKLA